MNSVQQWLDSLGLGQYGASFEENAVERDHLGDLDHEILKEIGVRAVGHRMSILKAAASLSSEPDTHFSAAEAAPSSVAPGQLRNARQPDRAEAERRQLTIMFADLVGSTQLSTQLEAEDLRQLNSEYQDAAKSAIEQFGGFVARYMGDGVLAYFGFPVAHEEDAERAVRAGLQLVERVGRLACGARATVRIGVATGQVIVGDLIGEGASQESAVVGETPNLAARLQASAEPGQVVIDEVTHAIARSTFETQEQRAELKGFEGLISYWRVVAERRAESRFAARRDVLSTFVGRDHELGLLLDRWEMSEAGFGHVALVSGEPGIGKSRITEELHNLIGRRGPHVRLRYQCSPFHSLSPFYPIVQHLKQAAAIASTDSVEQVLDKIERMTIADDEETYALFADLISIPYETRYGRLQLTANVQKQRTVSALVGELIRLANRQPVLFVLEDGHWIDPSTHNLVREAVVATAGVPVMIVITHRPGWTPGFAEQPRVVSLPLSRLLTRAAKDLADSVTINSVSDELVAEIVERSEGIPLFIEELTKALAQRVVEPGQVNVPATLQALLRERIDRLGSSKESAQAASVIGREFEPEMLAHVLDCPLDALTASLDAMTAVGLIHPRGTLEAQRYVWKHSLVQDVAYASLLRDRRKALHLKTAEALKARRTQAGAVIEPTLLAHHYRAAGLAEQAARYWLIAAQSSLAHAASEEIIDQARNALSDLKGVVDKTDTRSARSKANTLIGEAMMSGRGFGSTDVRDALDTALKLAREANDLEAEFEALRALGPHLLSTQGGGGALQAATRMLAIVDSLNDDKKRAIALDAAGTAHFLLGQQKEAEEALEMARRLVERAEYDQYPTKGGADIRIPLLGYLGYVLSLRGKIDRATSMHAKSLRIAQSQSHPVTIAWALNVAARVFITRGDLGEAERMLDQSVAVCDEHQLFQRKGQALALRGRALTKSGRAKEALFDIEEGLELWRQGGTLFHATEFLADGASAHLAIGDVSAARDWLDEAKGLEDSVGEVYNAAERLRLLAECQFREGERALARRSLEDAVALAHGQGAQLLELRSYCDLVSRFGDTRAASEFRAGLSKSLDACARGGEVPEAVRARELLRIA